jgi:hypothetical protein
MITAKGLAEWVVLAFVLWLAIRIALDTIRLRGAGIAAAILSWLIAGAVISMMPPLLSWLRTHLPT